MKRLPSHEQVRPVEFESLEARLLLNAAGLIQPDGPMPQAAAPGCGPPVEETSEAADVDGDGKLSLNDVKTNAAGEPTSLTFNGRGIDLNEDAKVDSLASADGAEPHGVHRPDSIDIDMLLIGKVLSNAGSAPTAGEIEFQGSYVVDLLSTEVDELAGSADGQVTLAYEPVWFSGAQAYLRGRVVDCLDGQAMRDGVLTKYEQRQLATTIAYEPVWAIGTGPDFNGRGIDLNEDAMVDSLGGEPTADLASRPIIEDILGSTEDFEYEGPADMPVMPQERPILEIVLGSTGDYEYTSEDQAPVASQAAAGYDGPDLYKYFEVDASRGGAGHCKIMAVRAANPESAFAAGGPLGAVMGGIGSILGGGGMLGKMLGPFA